jgi:hypothetical protein
MSARRVLAGVLVEVAHVELLSATGTLVAKRLPKSQLPAGDVLDAARSAPSADNDIGDLVHQAEAERPASLARRQWHLECKQNVIAAFSGGRWLGFIAWSSP